MNKETLKEYDRITAQCHELYLAKLKDYGPTWLIFRLPSLTDQILIKAKRIRTIEELQGNALVSEDVDVEYVGILNYCVMALIKLWYPEKLPPAENFLLNEVKVEVNVLKALFAEVVEKTKALMVRKNHDYGEAWRDMRLSSITDQILVKIQRVKSLEEGDNKPLVSEGIDAQYSDILNYCVFALIKLNAKTA